MQIVQRANTICMRRNKIVAYDELIRLREKINGADNAKGK